MLCIIYANIQTKEITNIYLDPIKISYLRHPWVLGAASNESYGRGVCEPDSLCRPIRIVSHHLQLYHTTKHRIKIQFVNSYRWKA